MSVGAVAVGGAVVGAAINGMAASDAASAGLAGTREGIAEQKRQFNLTRKDNMPWLKAGQSGINRLQYLLGLDPNVGGPMSGTNFLTRDQIKKELLPAFTSSVRSRIDTPNNAYLYGDVDRNGPTGGQYKTSDVIDDAGLNAAIEKRWAEQEAKRAELLAAAQNDPEFGSLLRKYDANAFWNDDATQMGLEYGMNEGTKGINRLAAATGGVQSGKTLKALTRFGQDYMGTKFNEGFNRDQVNKNSIYNKLAGISGAGQQASQQLGAAGANMANNVTALQQSAAGIRGASAIGQGNALTGALNGLYGAGKQNGWWGGSQPAAFGSSGLGGWGDSYSTSWGE